MSPDHFFPFISGHETNAKPLLSDLLLNILVTYSVKKKVTYQLSSVGAGRGRDGDPFFSHRPEVRLWGNSSLSEQSSSMSLWSYHDTELSAHQIVDISTLVCPFLSNPSKLVVPNLVNDHHHRNFQFYHHQTSPLKVLYHWLVQASLLIVKIQTDLDDQVKQV